MSEISLVHKSPELGFDWCFFLLLQSCLSSLSSPVNQKDTRAQWSCSWMISHNEPGIRLLNLLSFFYPSSLLLLYLSVLLLATWMLEPYPSSLPPSLLTGGCSGRELAIRLSGGQKDWTQLFHWQEQGNQTYLIVGERELSYTSVPLIRPTQQPWNSIMQPIGNTFSGWVDTWISSRDPCLN